MPSPFQNDAARAVTRFAVAATLPLGLLALGAWFGGLWVLAALLYMTTFTAVVDRAIARVLPAVPGAEFPAADGLSAVLAIGHLALMPLVAWALAGEHLGNWSKVGLFMASGQFMGQVSNANAHEMIHRAKRPLRRLGTAVYVSLLFGHHASAHPLVHHKWVASAQDPNSAPLGMSFWAFLPRAWIGSFRAGLSAESRRRQGQAWWRHPYAIYIGGALLALTLALVLGGLAGLVWYVALAGYATAQLLLSDYVQHYGLRRRTGPDGRLEPVHARHSWNAPHVWSSSMMLNAPRHSDHHSSPARPYPALTLPDGAAMLPASLPVMATLALFPPRWRKVMDRRARAVMAI